MTARVTAAESGMRLDQYLARHIPDECGPVSRCVRYADALRLVFEHDVERRLASAGLPILGDARYGGTTADDERVMLHASTLTLEHPMSGEVLACECPLPADSVARLSATRPRHRRAPVGPRHHRFG